MKKMTKIRKNSAVFPLFYAGTPRNAPKPPIFVKTPKIGVYTGGVHAAHKIAGAIYIIGGVPPPPPLSRGKRGGIPPKTPKTGGPGGGPNRFFGVPEKTRTALELSEPEGSATPPTPPGPPKIGGGGG